MGWGSGSYLMNEIISGMAKYVKDAKTRAKVYAIIIEAFENNDWDTQDECLGIDPAFDEAFERIHP